MDGYFTSHAVFYIYQGRNQKSYREGAHQIKADLGVVQRVAVAVFY